MVERAPCSLPSYDEGVKTKRQACSECGREALLATMERNGGICEMCAKEKAARAEAVEFKPWVDRMFVLISLVGPLGLTALAVYKSHAADWFWGWTIFAAGWVFLFSYQGFGYLIGLLTVLFVKFKIGMVNPKTPERDEY